MARGIELLSPAKDYATAVAAIDHGADAVYIGGPAFGARAAAGNSIDDLHRLADYAHRFRAKVYATVNTIVYDSELREAEALVKKLYRAGIDAVIVQDMALLRLDLPPVELHASTQCDTRTPEKARFLQDVGFSQIVLARELTLEEIGAICREVTVPVETFVHGALCVSYSGRCHAGEALMHRSANRGNCPQICRMKFDLVDKNGRAIVRDKHLLSLRDFNAAASVPELLEAGVSSFKIEGRLKDAAYVKNITAYYRRIIDEAIASAPEKYRRTSLGKSDTSFIPSPAKSFNRGFTSYFLRSRRPGDTLASIHTPKSLGEPLGQGEMPANGDGLAFFDPRDNSYVGFRVNKVENGRIIPARPLRIPRGVTLHRTFDSRWQKLMEREDTGKRRIAVDIELHPRRVVASDERGCRVVLPMEENLQTARKDFEPERIFAKTGNTVYRLRHFESHLPEGSYIPPSILTDMRRRILAALDEAAAATYRFSYRRKENLEARYPEPFLDYRDNVANRHARRFYADHGAIAKEDALETQSTSQHKKQRVIMTCRYCVLRQIGKCLKENPDIRHRMPLGLRMADGHVLPLHPDCRNCEMQVLSPE